MEEAVEEAVEETVEEVVEKTVEEAALCVVCPVTPLPLLTTLRTVTPLLLDAKVVLTLDLSFSNGFYEVIIRTKLNFVLVYICIFEPLLLYL